MTKFLLDSGNPDEYREIKQLAQTHNEELWGSTTNPSLIAKKLAGQHLSHKDAFALQKQLVLEIVDIVPGAVSAEVYADQTTSAQDMIEQGRDIASWHKRVVVKLPTTSEGMKARAVLRKEGITINNTLVFSQEQAFAISLQEKLLKQQFGPTTSGYPCFISPFVGRLDDKGQDGMSFVKNALTLVQKHFEKDLVWMLEASVRHVEHLKGAIAVGSELVTVPAKVYQAWFALSKEEQEKLDYHLPNLSEIPVWTPSQELLDISTVEQLQEAIDSKKLDISHPLTTAGIDKFVEDWQAILQ